MTKVLFTLFCAIVSLFLWGPAALAQECGADYELIVEMNRPKTGSYNVWDAVYGEQDQQERFRAGLPLPEGHVLAVGEHFVYGGGAVDLLLVEFDHRGRVEWEKIHKVDGLLRVKKMLRRENGYMIVGDRHTKDNRTEVWIGFTTSDGNPTAEQVIGRADASLQIQDIMALPTGGYMLAASARKEAGNPYAMVYMLDAEARPVAERAYAPGLPNQIGGLAVGADGSYYAAGTMGAADGRNTGWILKLAPDGAIIWQRQYPRGRAAQINVIAETAGGYVLAAGQSSPAGEGPAAGWVMLINVENGDVVWQRYYTSAMNSDNDVTALMVGKDGLATVMMESRAVEKTLENPDFVRLLTINGRGKVVDSDEYFNAESFRAYQVIAGPDGERTMIGDTDNVYQIEGPPTEEQPKMKVLRSLDGVVIAGTAMGTYDDPCMVEPPKK